MTIESKTKIFGVTTSRQRLGTGQEIILSNGFRKAVVVSGDEIRIPEGDTISTYRTWRSETVLTEEAINSHRLRIANSNTWPARITSFVVAREVHWRRG